MLRLEEIQKFETKNYSESNFSTTGSVILKGKSMKQRDVFYLHRVVEWCII